MRYVKQVRFGLCLCLSPLLTAGSVLHCDSGGRRTPPQPPLAQKPPPDEAAAPETTESPEIPLRALFGLGTPDRDPAPFPIDVFPSQPHHFARNPKSALPAPSNVSPENWFVMRRRLKHRSGVDPIVKEHHKCCPPVLPNWKRTCPADGAVRLVRCQVKSVYLSFRDNPLEEHIDDGSKRLRRDRVVASPAGPSHHFMVVKNPSRAGPRLIWSWVNLDAPEFSGLLEERIGKMRRLRTVQFQRGGNGER